MPSQAPTCPRARFHYRHSFPAALLCLTLVAAPALVATPTLVAAALVATPASAQTPSKGTPNPPKTKENEDKQALIRKILTGDDYKNTVLKFDYSKHQVSLKDMDKYWDKKNVYILDLRSPEQYKSGHIKGALHLGADILEDKLRKLVPDKKATIIVYCNNSLFPTRMISLTDSCLPQFSALGYENVFSLAPIWHDSPTYNRSFMEGPHWVKGESGK